MRIRVPAARTLHLHVATPSLWVVPVVKVTPVWYAWPVSSLPFIQSLPVCMIIVAGPTVSRHIICLYWQSTCTAGLPAIKLLLLASVTLQHTGWTLRCLDSLLRARLDRQQKTRSVQRSGVPKTSRVCCHQTIIKHKKCCLKLSFDIMLTA